MWEFAETFLSDAWGTRIRSVGENDGAQDRTRREDQDALDIHDPNFWEGAMFLPFEFRCRNFGRGGISCLTRRMPKQQQP